MADGRRKPVAKKQKPTSEGWWKHWFDGKASGLSDEEAAEYADQKNAGK